jgi:hypothetical protein
MEVRRDVFGLEGGAMLGNEIGRVVSPRRQHDVVDELAVLARAERAAVAVEQHVGEVVELCAGHGGHGGRVR